MINCTCPQCGETFEAAAGDVNRAAKAGSPKYCGRVCAGIARRKDKSPEQKRAEKSAYDKARREKIGPTIREKKRAAYHATKDREKEAAYRKTRMPYHKAYCQRPEYVAWKREYDKVYLAKKEYGEFWESAILALEIRRTCLELTDDTEIRRQKGTLNKKSNRRKEYDRTHSNKSEIGTLGHLAGA
jgi:hypothetical protein